MINIDYQWNYDRDRLSMKLWSRSIINEIMIEIDYQWNYDRDRLSMKLWSRSIIDEIIIIYDNNCIYNYNHQSLRSPWLRSKLKALILFTDRVEGIQVFRPILIIVVYTYNHICDNECI
jgi:hypothetical protein